MPVVHQGGGRGQGTAEHAPQLVQPAADGLRQLTLLLLRGRDVEAPQVITGGIFTDGEAGRAVPAEILHGVLEGEGRQLPVCVGQAIHVVRADGAKEVPGAVEEQLAVHADFLHALVAHVLAEQAGRPFPPQGEGFHPVHPLQFGHPLLLGLFLVEDVRHGGKGLF